MHLRRVIRLVLALAPVACGTGTAYGADGVRMQAPDWPHLLSDGARRAALALPADSPYHLDASLQDLEDAAYAAPPAAAPGIFPRLQGATPRNVRANDPAFDSPGATQAETAIAARGDSVVMAWNDSRGFTPGHTLLHTAWSLDGGRTFRDGGEMPLAAPGDVVYGSSTLDTDAAGNFYLAGVYATGAAVGIAVWRGAFDAGGFTWQQPVLAADGQAGVTDKPSVCTDRANGDVYVCYTRFGNPTRIEAVRGTALGTAWSAPVELDRGTPGIHGARGVVGPDGALSVGWQAGWGALACNLSNTAGSIRFRRAAPAAALAFAPPVTVAEVHLNWTSYWGGNLRNSALFLPDLAVDRTSGDTAGNLYVAWSEAAPWTANPASGTTHAEAEPNDSAAGGTLPVLRPGDAATGSIESAGDLDYWQLAVTAGQHVLLRLEPEGFACGVGATSCSFQLRLFKGVQGTAGDSVLANSNIANFAAEIVFDAPETAVYLVRVRNVRPAAVTTGTYTLRTRTVSYGAASPARDMRDICMAHSANGGAGFSQEALVNTGAANQDECIPALAVDGRGWVHAFFYDSRDAGGAKIQRHYYEAISTNGGVTFLSNQPVTDAPSYFDPQPAAVPNYGTTNQACTNGADPTTVHVSWSDARPGNGTGVDAYSAAVRSCVSAGCPADTAIAAGAMATHRVCITNCGTTDDIFIVQIRDSLGWSAAPTRVDTVAADSSRCVEFGVLVPAGTPPGTVSKLTCRIFSQLTPSLTAVCSMSIRSEAAAPVSVDGLAAVAAGGAVRLRWRLSADAVRDVRVVRVERGPAAPGPFTAASSGLVPAAAMEWEDAAASDPGLWYRLALETAHGTMFAGPVAVAEATAAARSGFDAVVEQPDGGIEVRYRTAATAPVRLEVFDVGGRRLATLAAAPQTAGRHSATWDRRCLGGARATRGVYVFKLTVSAAVHRRKIAVLRP